MGNLVFQATLGGQVNLVGPNTASTFNLNVPAVSSTIATTSGTETLTNKTLTSPVISGGTIDNAAIGGTTAAAGSFTTLAASSTLSVTGAGTIQGLTVGKGAGAVSTNTAVGASALQANTTGASSVAVGYQALYSNTTSPSTTAVGYQALYSSTGGYSTAVGYKAGYASVAGGNFTAVGYQAAGATTSGGSITAVGTNSLQANTTGSYNTSLGAESLYSNTTASNNTAVGYQAGYAETTGVSNTHLGYQAGYTSYGSNYNTFVGMQAGYSYLNNGVNGNNTFIGQGAGYSITSGTKNTIIGRYTGNAGGLDIRTASNYIVLSDGDGNPRGIFDSSGNLGVGQVSPTARVQANGTATVGKFIADGGSYTGNVLNVDTSGTAAGTGFNLILAAAGGTNQFRVRGDGTIYAQNTTVQSISDIRTKENIVDSTDGLSVVTAIRPVRFDYKEKFGNGKKNQLGFIAQEIEQVFPDAVDVWGESDEPDNPYKSVGPAALIPVLVKAIQEQQAIIQQLQADVAVLKGQA